MICLSRGPTWLIGSSLLKSFIDYTRCPTHCGPGEWRSNQAPRRISILAFPSHFAFARPNRPPRYDFHVKNQGAGGFIGKTTGTTVIP